MLPLESTLRGFAQRHPEIWLLELFGSATCGTPGKADDIDLLVAFAPHAEVTLPKLSSLNEWYLPSPLRFSKRLRGNVGGKATNELRD